MTGSVRAEEVAWIDYKKAFLTPHKVIATLRIMVTIHDTQLYIINREIDREGSVLGRTFLSWRVL